MKMLAISCASVMVVTNYGTAQNCVRPVQGFVSLGLYGAHSKIDGRFSQFGKLTDANLQKMLKQMTNDGLEINIVDKNNLKNFVKVKSGDLKYSNFDKNNTITLMETSNGTNGSQDWDDLIVKPGVDVTTADDGQSVTINYKTDFEGTVDNGSIVPKNGIYHDMFHKADGNYVDKDRADAVDSSAIPTGDAANFATSYDAKHPAPTISQSVVLDSSNLKDIYQIKISDKEGNSSWTGKKWQMAGFANLGLLVNFSQGGAWYLSVFGAKPFVNSTQNITFGNTSSNKGNNNNSNSIEAKDKWSLGIETGLRCNITEKVYLGIGVGVQWSWYEFSLKNSSENKDNNDSNTLKQDMKGTAPFMKLSLGFNINKNFGIEIFGKCTGKHDLKYKDGKKSKDDKSSNSSEWPINFTKQCSPSFGIAATFTF